MNHKRVYQTPSFSVIPLHLQSPLLDQSITSTFMSNPYIDDEDKGNKEGYEYDDDGDQ
jgi:hypothetical protein